MIKQMGQNENTLVNLDKGFMGVPCFLNFSVTLKLYENENFPPNDLHTPPKTTITTTGKHKTKQSKNKNMKQIRDAYQLM